MSCILNGCIVKFSDQPDTAYICDAYMVAETFIFKFNRDMYEHPIPPPQPSPDCVVDRNGEYMVWDRTADLSTLVVDAYHVSQLSDRLKEEQIRYMDHYLDVIMYERRDE